MRRNRTDIKLSVDRRKVNRIYWIITIFVILSPFTFLVYKTLNPPVSIEIKSLHDGYVSKIEQKKILIKSPFLEKKLTALKTKLANLNESQYAKKIMDSKISVKLTKEYDKKILNLKARGLATMSQVLFSHEKYNNALRQFRDSVKDYKNVKNEIKLEIELIELHIKSLDINLPEKSKIKVAVGSHIAKGQTVAIFYKSYHI